MTLPVSPVSERLGLLGIEYEWIDIPLDPERKPIRSLEELVEGRGMSTAQIVRSLVFRTGGGQFVLLAAPATGRADWGRLRKILGERRLTMAKPDEVLEATGYPIGAVPPLALPEEVHLLADEGIFGHADVIIGSGVLGYAIELRSQDLRRAMEGVTAGDFVRTK